MRLFNTLTRQKEEFRPSEDNKVKMYTCGPTVYNWAHIGNLRSYIFADVLRRVLEYDGYAVEQVMNITDVGHLTSNADEGEDKLEKGAAREGKTAWEVAEFYTNAFKEDIKKLNVQEPSVWCKATDHIKEQIEFVKKLEEKGFTYRTSDGIYFDSSKLPEYAELAKLDIEGMKAGARIDMREKRNITDFALWKFSPKDEKRVMEWDSPWGVGFPGWHIECSAMGTKYLGNVIDIHTGGIDHVPVHHTNERAQNIAVFGKPVVRFWMHHEHVLIGEAKMSKSKENFLNLNSIIEKGFDPLALRYLYLSAHYRSRVNFSWESLEAAQNTLKNLYERVLSWDGNSAGDMLSDGDYQSRFMDAINDDLDTPRALAVVWEMIKDNNLGEADKRAAILKFDKVMGLGLAHLKKEEVAVPAEVQDLINARNKARLEKNWAESDRLRDEIEKRGFLIEDTAEGVKVKKG